MLDVMSEIGHNVIAIGTQVNVLAGVLRLRRHLLPAAVRRGGLAVVVGRL